MSKFIKNAAPLFAATEGFHFKPDKNGKRVDVFFRGIKLGMLWRITDENITSSKRVRYIVPDMSELMLTEGDRPYFKMKLHGGTPHEMAKLLKKYRMPKRIAAD